jgi:hypothetical protein
MNMKSKPSSNRLSSTQPISAKDMPRVISMLRDVFKARNIGNFRGVPDYVRLGERHPSRKDVGSGDFAATRHWQQLRKWTVSANSTGTKSHW